MYCPKCGSPETGKFCRGCGTNLAVVSEAITDPAANHNDARQGGAITLGLFGPAAINNAEREITHHRAIAVFGEVTFDLTAAPLPSGETRISAYTLFGQIEILVHDEAGIRITGLSALSGVNVRGDAAHNAIFDTDEYVSPNYPEATRRLHIEVASLFAGIKIRR